MEHGSGGTNQVKREELRIMKTGKKRVLFLNMIQQDKLLLKENTFMD